MTLRISRKYKLRHKILAFIWKTYISYQIQNSNCFFLLRQFNLYHYYTNIWSVQFASFSPHAIGCSTGMPQVHSQLEVLLASPRIAKLLFSGISSDPSSWVKLCILPWWGYRGPCSNRVKVQPGWTDTDSVRSFKFIYVRSGLFNPLGLPCSTEPIGSSLDAPCWFWPS